MKPYTPYLQSVPLYSECRGPIEEQPSYCARVPRGDGEETSSKENSMLDKEKLAISVAQKVFEKEARGELRMPDSYNPANFETVDKPTPAQFLSSIGSSVGIRVTETDDFAAFFSVKSPLISLLELKMMDRKSRDNFTEMELSYITRDGTKTVVDIFDMTGKLQWMDFQNEWSFLGRTRVTKKEIHSQLDKTKSMVQKKIKKVLAKYEVGDTKNKVDLALTINDRLQLGLDPFNLAKLMNLISAF